MNLILIAVTDLLFGRRPPRHIDIGITPVRVISTPPGTVSFPEPQTTPKPWGHENLVAKTAEYTGKVLERFDFEPYHRAGLQYHPDRDETAHMLQGAAIFYWVDRDGVLRKRTVTDGDTVHIPRGVIHSFQTVGYSQVFETSTPGTEPAVRVEEQYDISTAVES